MRSNFPRFFSTILAVALLAACSSDSANPVLPGAAPARVRVLNAIDGAPQAQLIVNNQLWDGFFPAGVIRDISLPSGGGSVSFAVRVPGASSSASVNRAIGASEALLLIAHGTASSPVASTLPDTSGPMGGRVNIRIALLASDAPLLRVYVLPASQSLPGALEWLSTQAAYAAPLITTYFKGDPGSYRVYFTRYAPGGAEPLLAATGEIVGGATSIFLVTFDRAGAGYTATWAPEPTPLD